MKGESRGLVIIVSPQFKVYRGLPGFIDWRSHRAFSRFIKAGIYKGKDSDWLHLGEPLGPSVGSILCGGCDLPNEKASERECASICRSWFKANEFVWSQLKLKPLRWALSEEWQPFLEMWKPLFHNEEYTDVNRLKNLEERQFYGVKEAQSSRSLAQSH